MLTYHLIPSDITPFSQIISQTQKNALLKHSQHVNELIIFTF